MISTAVIMAAGMGTRFGQFTEKIPKGFVEFGGIPMVERSIQTLIDSGIKKIIIGTGYKKESYETLARKYPQIKCVYSTRYAETNSMYTLWNCREEIGDDDFLLLESDLVYEKKAITSLIDCMSPDVMLITPITKFQDQYYVEYNDYRVLTKCSVCKEDLSAKVNLLEYTSSPIAFIERCVMNILQSLKKNQNSVMSMNSYQCHKTAFLSLC